MRLYCLVSCILSTSADCQTRLISLSRSFLGTFIWTWHMNVVSIFMFFLWVLKYPTQCWKREKRQQSKLMFTWFPTVKWRSLVKVWNWIHRNTSIIHQLLLLVGRRQIAKIEPSDQTLSYKTFSLVLEYRNEPRKN